MRDYILAQAESLGLPAEVQRAENVAPGRTAENVIVRLPGAADSTRDVLITAHYDSAPSAPGAGDNGVSVAAMLETMRVLEAGEPLENDVVFLDLKMDLVSGHEVLSAIRENPPTPLPKIFVLTGSNEPKDRELVKNSGVAAGYVVKPLSSEHLASILGSTA